MTIFKQRPDHILLCSDQLDESPSFRVNTGNLDGQRAYVIWASLPLWVPPLFPPHHLSTCPQRFCICRYFCQDSSSPGLSVAYPLTSFRSLLKCHFIPGAYPHQITEHSPLPKPDPPFPLTCFIFNVAPITTSHMAYGIMYLLFVPMSPHLNVSFLGVRVFHVLFTLMSLVPMTSRNSMFVLVSEGCRNKLAQGAWLKTTETYHLMVMKSRCLKARCQ